jgi:hypothetical protein
MRTRGAPPQQAVRGRIDHAGAGKQRDGQKRGEKFDTGHLHDLRAVLHECLARSLKKKYGAAAIHSSTSTHTLPARKS